MNRIELLAKQTVKHLFRSYLVDNNIRLILSIVTEDIHWIDSRKSLEIHNIDQLERILGKKDAIQSYSSLDFTSLKTMQISDGCVNVFGCITVDSKLLPLEMRFTVSCLRQREDEPVRVCAVHLSTSTPVSDWNSYLSILLAENNFPDYTVNLQKELEAIKGDYDELTNSIPGGICKIMLDDELSIIYANEFFYQIFGYRYSSLQTMASQFHSAEFYLHPLDIDKAKKFFASCMDTKPERMEFEIRGIHSSGKTIWLLVRCTRSQAASDWVSCILIDITQRKEIEEQLRISEEEYRIAIRQHTGKMITRYHIAERKLHLPKWSADLLGLPTLCENVPYSLVENGTVAKDSVADYISYYEQMQNGLPGGSASFLLKGGNGEYSWFHSDFTMIYNENGSPVHAIVTLEDITEQRRKEQEQEKWYQYYKSHLDASIAYYEYNLTQNIMERIDGYLIPHLNRLTSRSIQDIAKFESDHFVFSKDRQKYLRVFSREALLANYYDQRNQILLKYRRLDPKGQPFWVCATIQLLPDPYSNDLKAFILVENMDQASGEEDLMETAALPEPQAGDYRKDMDLIQEQEDYYIALKRIYDGFLELNGTRNTYRVLYQAPEKYVLPEVPGNLTEDLGRELRLMVHPAERARFLHFISLENIRDRIQHQPGDNINEYFRILRKSGDYEWVTMTLLPLETNSGDEIYLCLICDIDGKLNEISSEFEAKIKTQQKLNQERMQVITKRTGTIILEWNGDDGTFLTPAAAEQFTFIKNLGREMNLYFLTPEDVFPEDWSDTMKLTRRILDGSSDSEAVVRLQCMDGSYPWCRVSMSVFRNSLGEIRRSIITINNVDEIVETKNALKYRQEYDTLTGHINFNRFKDEAAALIENRGDKRFSLWYCDVKNFKFINDIYGYDVGDHVLRYMTSVFADDSLRDEPFARISSDHFALFRWYENRSELVRRFQRMAEHLENYEELAGKKFRVELTSGIYCSDGRDEYLNIEDMLDRANMAQNSIKRLGGSLCAFYTEEMRNQILIQKEIEATMHQALSAGEFKVYLQPQVDIQQEDRIIGAEALIRWQRPGAGLVPPSDFIPLFEQNGFIVDLDLYVFEQVCRFLSDRRSQGLNLFKVACNVSKTTAFQADFAAKYIKVKDKYSIPDGYLELECTETTVVENAKLLDRIMNEMRNHGFLFSLDDFGSGYSSLNMLKDVTVDILKLDMMFFSNGLTIKKDHAIISNIIAMARELGMLVVAEGVETEVQLLALRALSCDFGQGYLFGHPVPMEHFQISPA